MARIVCPACEERLSAPVEECPYCGFPIPSHIKEDAEKTAKRKKKTKRTIFVVLLVLLALGITARNVYVAYFDPEVAREKAYEKASRRYNSGDYLNAMHQLEGLEGYLNADELLLSCKYNLAYEAMRSGNWDRAVSYLTDLNNEDSQKMLTDCYFMIDLGVTIEFYMENIEKPEWEEEILLSTALSYLEKYRDAEFFDASLEVCANEYVSGLEKQLEALEYERNSKYQLAWYGGMTARLQVLDFLYREYGFMAGNKDFVVMYLSHLEHYEKWFDAMCAMEVNGHKQVKDPVADNSCIELHLRNDTYFTSTQTFEVKFWMDEDQKLLLGTASETVENIGYYGDYVVRIYVPAAVRTGSYYYTWTNYYEDIILN